MAKIVQSQGIKTEFPEDKIIKYHSDCEPDVVLIVNNVRFHCHRKKLSDGSPYFQAMFNQNFAEKNKDVIEIKEVDAVALDTILSAIYADDLQITEEHSLCLLQTASLFQFAEVEKKCVDFLSRTMGPETCLFVYPIAERLHFKSLFNKARCIALWEFSSVRKTEAFLELTIDYIESYLSSNLLKCTDESEVFEAGISWVEGPDGDDSCQMRTELLVRVLSCVRFSSLKPDDVRTFLLYPTASSHPKVSAILSTILVLMESGVQQSMNSEEICKKMTDEDVQPIRNIVSNDEDTLMISRKLLAAPPRVPPEVPCVVGHLAFPNTLFGKMKSANNDDLPMKIKPYILYLSEETDELGKVKYTMKPCLALTKIFFGTTEACGYKVTNVGKDIFILGGQHYVGRGDFLNSLWSFKIFGEPGEGEWSLIGKLMNPRRNHTLCVLDDSIFLIGGYGKYRVLSETIERYHIPTGTWHYCSPCSESFSSPAACAYDGNMYVFGSQLHCYHPPSNKWSTITGLIFPKQISFSSAMVYQEWIYLTGNFSTQLMRFNPKHQLLCMRENIGENKEWTMELVGNFRNKTLNTCIVGHKIYSFALTETWHNFDLTEARNCITDHILEVEVYDIVKRTFAVLWTGGKQEIELEGGGKIIDFMSMHSAGCFSMIKF